LRSLRLCGSHLIDLCRPLAENGGRQAETGKEGR
jgi:hypothetical protein